MKLTANILLLGLSLFLAAGAAARPSDDRQMQSRTPEQRAEIEAQRLGHELSLDDRQRRDVCKILLRQARQKEEIQMKRRAADNERRKRLEKVVIAERSAMKRVLNDVQYQQWEKQQSAVPVHHLHRAVPRQSRDSLHIERSGKRPPAGGTRHNAKGMSGGRAGTR